MSFDGKNEAPDGSRNPSSSDGDTEKQSSNRSDSEATLIYDHNGLPLVPQPSQFKDDPLVCISHECGCMLIVTELVIVVEMGSSPPSRLYGLPRAI